MCVLRAGTVGTPLACEGAEAGGMGFYLVTPFTNFRCYLHLFGKIAGGDSLVAQCEPRVQEVDSGIDSIANTLKVSVLAGEGNYSGD